MSSGKKRRTQSERAVVGSIDRSPWARTGLYVLFTLLMVLLALSSSSESLFVGDKFTAALFAFLFSIVAIGVYELVSVTRINCSRVLLMFGGLLVHMGLVQLVCLISSNPSFDDGFKLLVLPYAFAPMIHSVLLGRRAGVFTSLFVALFGSLMVPGEKVMYYIVINVLVGVAVVLQTRQVRRRGSLLRAGLYAGLTVLLLGVMFSYIDLSSLTNAEQWQLFGMKFFGAVFASLLISMIVSGVLPILEVSFGITTDISWLELSDLNHKLLRQLQLEAPGTFHHSLVVASLAEAAAESVGANAAMCRVCAYFHDVGKLKKPEYFIENQGDINPHDSLTPTMSALVIIAHVKDGVDIALKYKLNPRVIDVIKEHHGDSLVYYFYRKAQERRGIGMDKCDKKLENREDLPEIDEKNFRYPGPRPQTKESGIISLADAVESASRTLNKPTPAKIQGLVDDIVRARMQDGQLDDCDLSLKELSAVRESFAKTLRSMLHSRIDYPKEEDGGGPRQPRPTSPVSTDLTATEPMTSIPFDKRSTRKLEKSEKSERSERAS